MRRYTLHGIAAFCQPEWHGIVAPPNHLQAFNSPPAMRKEVSEVSFPRLSFMVVFDLKGFS